MQDWIEIVVCPACGSTLNHDGVMLTCGGCGLNYAIIDGIPVLMRRGTPDTLLDVKAYAEATSIAPRAVESTYSHFQHAVGAGGKSLEGMLLEIGTGTGLLTEAMLRHANFQQIVSTDVSFGFLRSSFERLKGLSPEPLFMACDGNVLPLRKGIFDIVLGRSVLHHLLHYRKTLQQVYELLRPGGVAAFFEPVQTGKALISFMFRIILSIDASTTVIGLTQGEKERMNRALKGMMKSVTVKQSPEILAKMEDKYIFDIDKLCAEATTLGFKAQYVNSPNVDPTYFSYLNVHLRSFGVRPEVIARVSWLKEAFGDTVGAISRERLSAPMGFFVFRKATV